MKASIFSIEAKSGTSTSLVVPADQIERCLEWIKTFEIYKTRKVLLAFKFLSKKRIGLGIYESRELREFFKIWDESLEITDCVCTYDGEFFAKTSNGRKKISLREEIMPFKTKQPLVPNKAKFSHPFLRITYKYHYCLMITQKLRLQKLVLIHY